MAHTVATLDQIISLAKRRGYVFPTSEIYGGLVSSYDYGPAGAQLLRNLKNLWWEEFVNRRDDMVGLDSQIILNPQTWVASGHVTSFNDPLVEDKVTHERFRADHLIESWLKDNPQETPIDVTQLDVPAMAKFLQDHGLKSPSGNDLTEPKAFNLLFESSIGVVSGDKAKVYLRGETAQGIFSNFKNILDSTRLQLPFGVAQIGKSFRNEITSGQFVFRTLEFEQAEIEYFFDPKESDWHKLMDDWKDAMWHFVTSSVGLSADNLQWRRHSDKERSHYSKDTFDLDYRFPFGFKELWGVAYRTDYDLKQHQSLSGQSLEYTHPHTNQKFIPHVIEPALGVNRLFLALLTQGYHQDPATNRVILKLPAHLSPYQVAVFPLLKNKPELVDKARSVYQELKKDYRVTWDERGNIGKRYYSQDELGTPFCLTIDFETLENESLTVRQRDSGQQERVNLSKLGEFISSKIK